MTNTLLRFRHKEDGATIVLFAFAIVMFITAIGVAIDMGRVFTARSHAAAALDAALLGAAAEASAGVSRAEIQRRANEYYNANYKSQYVGARDAQLVLNLDGLSEGKISGFTDADIPLAFGAFVGMDRIQMPVSSQVERFLGVNMEIALTLDYTQSMCKPSCANKFDVVRNSVGTLIDELKSTLESSAQDDAQVSIAFIPFGHGVKVDDEDNLRVSFGPGENNRRDNINNLREQSVQPAWFAGLPVVRGLTTQLDGLNSYIQSFTTTATNSGGTNTAAGVLMGWKSLRSQDTNLFRGMSSHENSAKAPLSFNDLKDGNVIKVMIILSDGSNTFWYTEGPPCNVNTPPAQCEYRDENADDRVERICNTAKREGILIYAIAFVNDALDPDPATARALMRGCASEPENNFYYEPNSAEALRETFRDIANSLVDKLITK